MTNAEHYKQIATYFETALDGLIVEPALAGAIKVMKICPKVITKNGTFNATLWEMIETCCNESVIPIDEDRLDLFIAGCSLLEQISARG